MTEMRDRIQKQLTALPALFRAPYAEAYETLFETVEKAWDHDYGPDGRGPAFKDHGLERNALMFFHATRLAREVLKENGIKISRVENGAVLFEGAADAPEGSLGEALGLKAAKAQERAKILVEMERMAVVIPLAERFSVIGEGEHSFKISGHAAMAIAEHHKMIAELGKPHQSSDPRKAMLGREISSMLSLEFGITILSAEKTLSLKLDHDEVALTFRKDPELEIYEDDPSP